MKVPEQPRQFELWINGELTAPDSGRYITRISPAVEEYTEEKSVLFSLGKRQPWW